MAVIYPNPVKIARMAAVVAQAGATAVLEIGTTGMAAVLATFPLNNPIAPAATGAGVLAMSGFPKTDAGDATGTPAVARVRAAVGGADIMTGLTVGLTGSGADAILDSMSITQGQAVTLNSFTVTHAA